MSDTDFIIRRLRSVDFTGDRILPASTVEEVVLPAAEEIERLRNVVAEKTSQAMTFHAENERLRSAVSDCRIEIQRLTAERDEARRELCIKELKARAMHRIWSSADARPEEGRSYEGNP